MTHAEKIIQTTEKLTGITYAKMQHIGQTRDKILGRDVAVILLYLDANILKKQIAVMFKKNRDTITDVFIKYRQCKENPIEFKEELELLEKVRQGVKGL